MHVQRRLLTISRTYALLVLVLAFLPALLVAGLVVDVARYATGQRRFVTLRLLAFALVFLSVEAWMLPRLGIAWLLLRKDNERLLATTATQQGQFAATLLHALIWLFQVRLEVQGTEFARSGPFVLLVRHTSIADTLLPTVLLSLPHQLRLRFVLKQELQQDPCLDIAGNRLPNLFVSRRKAHAAQDLAGIVRLATDLGPRDGVLIYPEGTRFTLPKRDKAVAALRQTHPELAQMAQQWKHVMPPKLGGVLAALEGAPDADVVWMGHQGLEGLADLAAIWRGQLVGTTVRVQLWRTPRSQVPVERAAQAAWLFAQWQVMDTWVDNQAKAKPEGGL